MLSLCDDDDGGNKNGGKIKFPNRDEEKLKNFATCCSQFWVYELNLENCGVLDEDLAMLCKYLENSRIEKINLGGNGIGMQSLIEISNCKGLKNLKFINLENVDLPLDEFELFIEIFSFSCMWLNTIANYLLWNTSDIEKALKYYEKSAEMGNAEAQYQFSSLICFGNVCNPQKSRYWLEKAAVQEHIPALDSLADILKEEEEKENAIELYFKSAHLGSAHSMYELSKLYRDGINISQNLPQSLTWLVKAANRGNSMALSDLGMEYLTGRNGFRIDINKAMRCFFESREISQSQLQIGLMYLQGNEVIRKNVEKAIEWLEKASLLEDEAADLLVELQ